MRERWSIKLYGLQQGDRVDIHLEVDAAGQVDPCEQDGKLFVGAAKTAGANNDVVAGVA